MAGDFEQALNYFQKDLDISIPILGDDDDDEYDNYDVNDDVDDNDYDSVD